jgi:predicted Zn-dependent peptidase
MRRSSHPVFDLKPNLQLPSRKAFPRVLSLVIIAVCLQGLLLIASARAAAPSLKLPEYQTRKLDNGLTLLLMKHGEVPLVNFEMWILDGAASDPAKHAGLASLCAESLRKGAGERDAAAFAEALDFLGANFTTRVDHDRTAISFQCLSKDFDEGLALFADAVLRPRFEAEEIEKLTQQMSEDVSQAKDNPRFVLGDYHDAHLYGNHPYGQPVDGTEQSLSGIKAEEVRSFYRDHYGAGRTILAVVGNFEMDEAARVLQKTFASMQKARVAQTKIPAPKPVKGREVLLVNKPDTPQTWFHIGNLGPKWGDPDYAAVELVRTVFGGRFTSWLNTKLRIESGLSYGAGYTIDRRRQAGSEYISSFTAKETTEKALDLALQTLKRLHEKGLDQDELNSARAYLKGQTPYRYESSGSLARVLCLITAYGLGREFVDGRFAALDELSLSDCKAAIAKWYPEENLSFTCIGVADEVKDVLAKYGTVRVRENDEVGFH